MTKSGGRAAWLVTWEHAGDHARPDCRIAAVLSPHLSGRRVRELVGFLYASLKYTPFEQLEIVLGLRTDPYPASFGQTKDGRDGLWRGEVICGDNPWLRARLVDDLVLPVEGEVSWKDRPRPHRIEP